MSQVPCSRRLRLVLADDHPEVLRDILDLLESEFDIVAIAHDGQELLRATAEFRPDVVVSDIHMPAVDGMAATRSIMTDGTCRTIVLLTMYNDMSLAEQAVAAGARAFVLKVDAVDDLIPAIRCAAAGGIWLSRRLS